MNQQEEISNEEILRRTKEIVEYLCGKDHDLDISLDASEGYDPLIIIEGAAIGWDFEEENPFYYGAFNYYPGVRYYPDGSGEPPSEEFEPWPENYSWESFACCVFEAVKIVLTKRLSDYKELQQEKEAENSVTEVADILETL